MLYGVTAVSDGDVWAVGQYYNGTNPYQTLVERWNGTAWSVVASPNITTTANNFLRSVAVVSASDVWAVGYYYSGFNPALTLVEHWNGTAWSIVSNPNPGTGDNVLYGVAAVSAGDVWAVGSYSTTTAVQTLVEHWNGTAWSVVSSPNHGPVFN